MSIDLSPGRPFPDIELADHASNRRRLSQLTGGDPAVLQFFRGWWCPKEQAFFRRLITLQEEAEVAYSRIVSVSVDAPAVNAAFRAGLGARWTFLSDPERSVQEDLGLRETTDTLNDPYGPALSPLADDPFARIFPARILRVSGGVLGAVAAPAGPTIERYGSANPWPWDRFDLGGES